MYSPKIKDSLVRRLYHLKEKTGKPMTVLVNKMLVEPIKEMEARHSEKSNNTQEHTG
jgi:predicted DNA-binding protein